MPDISVLGAITRGMVAGAVGTTAMTISERLEMSISGREGSQVPGQVGANLLPGRDPHSQSDLEDLSTPVHWAHGISVGALRGLLDVAGIRGPAASAAHFALLWVGDAALYRALGIADVPWRWGATALGTDLFHKGVYAAVAGASYDAMARSRPASAARHGAG